MVKVADYGPYGTRFEPNRRLFFSRRCKKRTVNNALIKIIGIDTFIPEQLKNRLKNRCDNKLILIQEDSTSETLIEKLKKTLKNYKSFYIHLASNHTHEHVLKKLNLYSQFLKKIIISLQMIQL